MAWFFGKIDVESNIFSVGLWGSMLFLMITGVLLVKDLDQPKRFLYVLLRPHWNSWLVKGAYAITVFGGLLALLLASKYFNISFVVVPLMWTTAIIAVIVSIYTAFLFAQAKGRDFWQSPTLSIHMLVHSIMAGAAVLSIINFVLPESNMLSGQLVMIIVIGIAVNLFTILLEMITTHPTMDAKITVNAIIKGRYKNLFWLGVVLLGNLVPLFMFGFFNPSNAIYSVASILVLSGIYITEHIWVEAPQRIPLS
jgi:formate-dependent nitrite reductase membrane component NrfD